MTPRLLMVGGGLAAQRCCEVLRAAGDDRPITIVGAEPVRPYDRPPLSKAVPLGDVCFRPTEWYAERGIELRLGAHGDCADVAPEAFRVDDVAVVIGETTDERMLAAARACPAGAILLHDADTGAEVDA